MKPCAASRLSLLRMCDSFVIGGEDAAQGRGPRQLRRVRVTVIPAKPNFGGKLCRIVDVEGLIKFFGQTYDRRGLDAKRIRDRRFRFAQRQLNANLQLRRRRAALAQNSCGTRKRMFAEFNRHR